MIRAFTVTSNPDGIVATSSSTPVIVRGLTPGVEYTFTVTASSAVGTSEPSLPSERVTVPIEGNFLFTLASSEKSSSRQFSSVYSFTLCSNAVVHTTCDSYPNADSSFSPFHGRLRPDGIFAH